MHPARSGGCREFRHSPSFKPISAIITMCKGALFCDEIGLRASHGLHKAQRRCWSRLSTMKRTKCARVCVHIRAAGWKKQRRGGLCRDGLVESWLHRGFRSHEVTPPLFESRRQRRNEVNENPLGSLVPLHFHLAGLYPGSPCNRPVRSLSREKLARRGKTNSTACGKWY